MPRSDPAHADADCVHCQIDATKRLVYDLYGLTEEEVKIVEDRLP